MVFIDTSVWIEFFKGRDQYIVDGVNRLLDRNEVALSVPVWLEILCGAPKQSQKHLRKLLSALPIFYTTEDTWNRAAAWALKASSLGERFSALDLLIASFTIGIDASIWSLDKDFKRMEKLKLVTLHTGLH